MGYLRFGAPPALRAGADDLPRVTAGARLAVGLATGRARFTVAALRGAAAGRAGRAATTGRAVAGWGFFTGAGLTLGAADALAGAGSFGAAMGGAAMDRTVVSGTLCTSVNLTWSPTLS